ncbi:peptide methionine sulfoxide reductase [Endogone sp. FLAS-F59071]|nr:peptide methionine sulfoxide reductase [Endogone sp. FLAS-F59071]|eukprot:RUS14996.1 peptide methionine sulfoxide reductase [Endogone sp. FLAS-F59071]
MGQTQGKHEAPEPLVIDSKNTEIAIFAAGCFWQVRLSKAENLGVEKMFNKHYGKDGIQTRVGYTGGKTVNPTYNQVCFGDTDHAEAIRIHFDPNRVSYGTLVEFFYRMHNATQLNRQGPDIGTQYRSAIFYHSPEQLATIERVTKEVQETKNFYKGKKIQTLVVQAGEWHDAEAYHQKYLETNTHGYECPSHHLYW